MGVNKYLPHLLVLPEDDANRQLANGFVRRVELDYRRIDILPPAGGWPDLRNDCLDHHISGLQKYQQRHLVLLLDGDENFGRLKRRFREVIGNSCADRLYVLGVGSEPEQLASGLGSSLEDIGERLALECFEGTENLWGHALIRHNNDEVARLKASVNVFLFPRD